MDMQHTIAAIATAQAAGGIGVLRISGAEALHIADKIFSPVNGKKIADSVGYRAYFGKAINSKGSPLDEAVCLVFRAPHSYTGEDVAELSLHGGLFIMQKALEAAFAAGARPAEPGEFTKKAFLNGKIDLSEAEAVMGLISAQGEQAAQASLHALEGNLSREIKASADKIISAAASMAAWVDYPDDDIEEISSDNLKSVFTAARKRLTELLHTFDTGMAVTNGVLTAIAGRPNVGKSALMNLLTGYERSIVTPFAGTTRDIVEETVRMGSIVLRLADTAGIHSTDNPVESIGIEMARKKLGNAQLILAVFDGSQALTDEDISLLEFCRDKNCIAIVNKTDLAKQLNSEDVGKYSKSVVEISAVTGEGLDALEKAVSELLGTVQFNPCAAMLSTERQRDCCRRAVNLLTEAIDAIDSGVTLDAVNVCADACISALLELTGEKASEAVINEVFSRFCVGK